MLTEGKTKTNIKKFIGNVGRPVKPPPVGTGKKATMESPASIAYAKGFEAGEKKGYAEGLRTSRYAREKADDHDRHTNPYYQY